MRASIAPTGTVTFLFTDIEGSTRLWQAYPDEMPIALARHDALMRQVLVGCSGHVFKTTGDGFCAAFDDPTDALLAALTAQLALASEPWPIEAISVRMAVHTGAVEQRDDDYFGQPLSRVARILAIAHGGQTLVAHSTFELVRDALPEGAELRAMGEHRLKDLARPETVFQLCHPDLADDFPPLRSLDHPDLPNNLPRQVTSFVGRTEELFEVGGLLRRNRLLTLTGSGGCGKTRLALQVAAEALGGYPDGVWFVELAPLTDPALVPEAIARVLGIREDASSSIASTLTEEIADKKLVLVLDNCEHLLGATAEVADVLLHRCAGVKVLATSREPLAIPGEQVYRVPSMSLPETGTNQTLESLSQYESVRLFIDRALLARPDFRVTNESAPIVAELCIQLDGIPLAIELAAARARSMSIDSIYSHIKDRFRLLTGGSRTALPRQQTLYALIAWSHNLLSDRERELFDRLGIFQGGFTANTAHVVCMPDLASDLETLDLLGALVDKSLIQFEPETERYRMLESMRQFAWEKLDASGQRDLVTDNFVEHFAALADQAFTDSSGDRQGVWTKLTFAERENIIHAHALCDTVERLTLGARIAIGFSQNLMRLGYGAIPLKLVNDSVHRGRGTLSDEEWCRLLSQLGRMHYMVGNYDDADRCLSEVTNVSEQAGDGVAWGKRNLSVKAGVLIGKGDLTKARELCDWGLALAEQEGNKVLMAMTLNSLGEIERMAGNLEASLAHYDRALSLEEDETRRASCLLNLAMVSIQMGDPKAASARGTAGVAQIRAVGAFALAINTAAVAAGLAGLLKRWHAAAWFHAHCRDLARRGAMAIEPPDLDFLEPREEKCAKILGQQVYAKLAHGAQGFPLESGLDRAEQVFREVSSYLAKEPEWPHDRPLAIESPT